MPYFCSIFAVHFYHFYSTFSTCILDLADYSAYLNTWYTKLISIPERFAQGILKRILSSTVMGWAWVLHPPSSQIHHLFYNRMTDSNGRSIFLFPAFMILWEMKAVLGWVRVGCWEECRDHHRQKSPRSREQLELNQNTI